MGLFDSKKTTTSTDNRVVNDYSGADLSQIVDKTTDSSITGEYAGNTGNITVTDGGAIDLAESLSSDALSLASEMGDLSASMLGLSLSSSNAAFSDAATLIDNQAQNNLSAAMGITEASLFMLDSNNDFAMNLAAQNGETMRMQNESSRLQSADNSNALNNGFKSMMQFAEGFSRSDSANIETSSNKTLMLLGGLGAVSFIAYTFWGKR